MNIDVNFDMRSHTPQGKDPDSHSRTLRAYHRLLWSKKLPSGARFDLSVSRPGVYLHHSSELGEFFLASDAAVRTFRTVRKAASVIEQIPDDEREAFGRPLISDRLDLTLECIRRHYLDEPSPLDATLTRYDDFFALFGDFRGYVNYFLLQELVTDAFQNVRFFTPFAGFTTSAIPQTVEAYQSYRRLTLEFVAARNGRIAAQAH